MGSRAIRYLVFLALVVVGSFPTFAQSPYPTIVVNTTGTGTGTVATVVPSEEYPNYIEVWATPDLGSDFVGWGGCDIDFWNVCLIAILPTRSVTLTATFDLQNLALVVAKAGNGMGTVTSDVHSINCGATCAGIYVFGTVVTLTATAGGGQTFAGWSGAGCSGTGTCVVAVGTATTVTATFTDAIPPNTTIATAPTNPSSKARPTFTFSSTEPGSTFQCQLDGATRRSCTSPHTVSVGDGPHTFAVFAVDAGGNADPTPATYSWTVAPDPAVDLNQHGLTGSWYEPASAGQGFAVEVFPDRTSGSGRTFVSWFTFDTVVGGAERQRWYTAEGEVVTGQSSVSLTIYQNTGGNFDAPPATHALAVGTAMLSFATCSTGTLSYTFTDGRSGTIPLTRLLPNVTCSVTDTYPTHADFALSGSWHGGAETSGQGFAAEVAPASGEFFLSWFTYIPNGANAGVAGQRWYTAQGNFTPGLRTIPVEIYETTGGVFDGPTPPGQRTVSVGAGTMTFQSCSAATFSFGFTGGSSIGKSGTITLSRVGPVPPDCTT